ncbi:acyl-CoA dehydrogenase family protein, partial [Bdellovibrionota bacterium]
RTTIAGISLGLSKAAVELMLWYGEERQQFGKPISDFQFIQKMLADASAEYDAASSLVYRVAGMIAKKQKCTRMAASAKLFAAEAATRAGMSAIQVLGGYGYTREYPAERLMRDAKLMEIGAGTSEIMRHIIARDLRRGA